MPKTLGALVTEVRDRLDEATAAFWTEVQLRKWINEGARNISRQAEVLEASGNVTIVAGTAQYTGPVDVVRVNRAEWRPTGQTSVYPLEYRDYAGMDTIWATSQAITQGYPSWFTLWGFPPTLTLILYPVPSVAGVVKLFYYRLSAELATDGSADASNVDVPEGWWDLIVDYAEYTALRKDRDPRWQEAKTLYEQRIMELIDNTRRWADQAGQIEFASAAGGVPAWLYGGEF